MGGTGLGMFNGDDQKLAVLIASTVHATGIAVGSAVGRA